MSEAERYRRSSLLATLAFSQPARVRELVREMESIHGVVVSTDLVRVDLAWLAEMGLVRVTDDTAICTERGLDIARRRAKLPGE